MPKAAAKKKLVEAPAWDSQLALLAWLATCVSVFSFLFFYQRGEILLYGDAAAHINIARRVFDSKTPGLLQLGTVWLPLPHLLMIPFLISNELWSRGAGGSIPSMAGYVFGVVGIFRLVRGVLSRGISPKLLLSDASAVNISSSELRAIAAARFAAWTAALIYAANPNLIYMQATAMGEAVYLAFFIWAVVYFSEFLGGESKALMKCGACVAAACLTRYDAWLLAVVLIAAVAVRLISNRTTGNETSTRQTVTGRTSDKQISDFRARRSTALKFILIAASAPALWLVYNGIVYRNPLEFENGPYSAKAIERKTQNAGNPGHPGSGNVLVAGMYFVKAAEENVAENPWLQRAWILLAFAALIGAVAAKSTKESVTARAAWPVLLLFALPLFFYALSVAYGGVPIFVPAWWPFTYYNLRYGLQLLPLFAVAFAVMVFFAARLISDVRLSSAAIAGIFVLGVASYATVWRDGPASLREAQVNMRIRNQFEKSLADWLKHLPPDSTLLMYLGDHVGALEQADIPLRRVINEGNHRVWKHPTDPDGLWERALANPSSYADYVVAFEGDPVWQAMQAQHLRELIEMHVTGQSRLVVYRAR
jgi:preprotein translocase subunit SecG